tara:strand:- start:17566 stop:18516 length:951 start_codon:yes stop_codon:yes gene_type:complete
LKPLKIIFAGTPDFAALHLKEMLNSEHEVVAVYTKQDKPAGRGKKLQPSPVKQLALAHDLPVEQPKTLRDETVQAQLAAYQADVMVVVAYGLILPQAVLDMPALGCINVHGSLLPQWRGAAPIQRSLWAGDTETGVTIMQMDAGLDTGPMLHKASCIIEASDTSATLYDKLAQLGPQALLETLTDLAAGTLQPEIQDDAYATYAEKLSKAEALIDWNKTAVQLDREVRAFNPWPMSYFKHQDQVIKVRQVSIWPYSGALPAGTILNVTKQGIDVVTGEGVLRLEVIQLPNKKFQPVQDVINAYQDLFVAEQNIGAL